ncbi:MAG: hypothetical protein LWW85_00565 [Marinilabiliales bacterium]|nr:hypothetical protein [Marinilabiliales bacterium]
MKSVGLFFLLVTLSLGTSAKFFRSSLYKSTSDLERIALPVNATPATRNSLLVNVGTTAFSGIMNKSTEVGVNCAVSFNRLQLGISSNFMNDQNKLNIGLVNLGYIVPILQSVVSVIPVAGIGVSNGNYEGSYGCDFHHSGDRTYYWNLGLNCTVRLAENMGIFTGIGTFESFRMGVILGRF